MDENQTTIIVTGVCDLVYSDYKQLNKSGVTKALLLLSGGRPQRRKTRWFIIRLRAATAILGSWHAATVDEKKPVCQPKIAY